MKIICVLFLISLLSPTLSSKKLFSQKDQCHSRFGTCVGFPCCTEGDVCMTNPYFPTSTKKICYPCKMGMTSNCSRDLECCPGYSCQEYNVDDVTYKYCLLAESVESDRSFASNQDKEDTFNNDDTFSEY
jgi:hypothetical protein